MNLIEGELSDTKISSTFKRKKVTTNVIGTNQFIQNQKRKTELLKIVEAEIIFVTLSLIHI